MRALLSAGLDLLYSRACQGCGGAVAGEQRYFCWDCLAGAEFIQSPYCERCGDPAEGMIEHAYTCSFCTRHEVHFERARSAVRYRGPIAELLQSFKYRGATYLAHDLAGMLAACLEAHYAEQTFDGIVAVPMTPARERLRTYNQAWLLAVELGRYLGLPVWRTAVARVRDTGTQTRLKAAQRRRNVRGAFGVREPHCVDGRRLLVVDDVMTTGATCAELAGTLYAAGCRSVHVVTVARG